MRRVYRYSIKTLESDNEMLRYQIIMSKKKREEASANAESLAELNYYLEKDLEEVSKELANLRRKNERYDIKSK